MPQFQIRRHPHGHTFQVFFALNKDYGMGKPWLECNSVQECISDIVQYVSENTWIVFDGIKHTGFYLEVLPD